MRSKDGEFRGLSAGDCVRERRKTQQHQGFGRCKPADRGVKDTANAGKNILPDLSTGSGKGSTPPNAIHRFG